MDKLTYLAELAEGLARWVPERERQDILRYYAEYFEEAGPDREAQVVAELGDPWALSCRLAVEGGYVTQQQAESWTPPKRKKWPWVLAGTLACVAFIGMSVAYSASQIGRFVGQFVGQRAEQTAVVEAGDNAQFGTAVEGGAVYYEEKEGQGGGFWSVEDGCLDVFHEIDVDVSIANVAVTGGEDYTLSISSNSTLGGYSLKWEVKDGVLKLRDGGSAGHVNITSWDDFKNVFGVNASAMDVVVTIPTGPIPKRVLVKTGLGDVFLSGLEVDKKVKAETGLGDIECYEVRVQDEVELETGMGDVTLGVDGAYNGVKFDLKTGMGTIEAQLNNKEAQWDYETKTGMGTVTVNGDSRGTKAQRKGGSYELEAETGMGDINLYFQEDRW